MEQRNNKKPWEQFDGESAKAFEAFAVYRDQGSARSCQAVARALHKSSALVRRWRERWYWSTRVQAWDTSIDNRVCETQAKARVEMAERHAKIAMLAQQKILEGLKQVDPADASIGELLRSFEVAAKIERLARGEPTERQEVQGSVTKREEYYIEQRLQRDPETAKLLEELYRRSRSLAGDGEK